MRRRLGLAVMAGFLAHGALAEEKGGVVAIVAGRPVSEAEFRAAAGNRLIAVENQAFTGREKLLNEFIEKLLLETEAASRGVTVEALVGAEVEAKIKPPTDAETALLREQNRERLVGVPEAQANEALREAIVTEHRSERRQEFIQELRDKAKVRVLLEPPRVTLAERDTPSLGPKGAPVTIVEYSDFECPYCAQAAPIMKKVLETYPDKVRFVFRDFPLSNIHPNAAKAAEAGECAREQGKFWEMHDKLFADQKHLTVPDLKSAAQSLGLDKEAFASCLDSSRTEATWKAEAAEGESYGVSGTPFFFVNGRIVNGVVPFQAFKNIVDQEIERAAPAPAQKKTAP
jgi:protein-disulfide isomerase